MFGEVKIGEVLLLLFELGRMVLGLGLTCSGWRGLMSSDVLMFLLFEITAAASNSLIMGLASSAVWRSQMYWMTLVMTSSFESFRFFGMKGTKSLSLLMYIWTSAFSPSRCRLTRPLAIDGTEAPVEHTAVMAFILFWWILTDFFLTTSRV